MTDAVKEQLSACLDGQLPEGELDLMLKRVQRDRELRRTLDSYSLIGESLRGNAVRASSGFADRISEAIAAEPALHGAPMHLPRERMMRWLRPVGGLAVAASVAAVAVLSFRPPTSADQHVARIVTDTPQPDDASASYTVPTNVDRGTAFVPAARLTNYVVAHSEYSSPLARRTVLSGVLSDDQDSDSENPQVEADVHISGTPSTSKDPASGASAPARESVEWPH